MKPSLLIISHLHRSPIIDSLFEGLSATFSTTIEKIPHRLIDDFNLIMMDFNAKNYDLVLLDIPHKYLRRHLKTLLQYQKNIVIYEEDLCQNYIPDSPWYSEFTEFYRNFDDIKVISTGSTVVKRLKEDGVFANFLPKGFDSTIISPKSILRDIDLGFIGSFSSDVYVDRYNTLRYIDRHSNLQCLRTSPGKEYNDTLNRISAFFSADINIGEYMAKNFEAMAAGCLLIAYRQGNGEEEALGFKDGENILLYSDRQQALEKINWTRDNQEQAKNIALAGTQYVNTHFSFDVLSKTMSTILLRCLDNI
jgi:glycosyltransferase involved in cell wall biosynthesis